jgi:hypothetical protein
MILSSLGLRMIALRARNGARCKKYPNHMRRSPDVLSDYLQKIHTDGYERERGKFLRLKDYSLMQAMCSNGCFIAAGGSRLLD